MQLALAVEIYITMLHINAFLFFIFRLIILRLIFKMIFPATRTCLWEVNTTVEFFFEVFFLFPEVLLLFCYEEVRTCSSAFLLQLQVVLS